MTETIYDHLLSAPRIKLFQQRPVLRLITTQERDAKCKNHLSSTIPIVAILLFDCANRFGLVPLFLCHLLSIPDTHRRLGDINTHIYTTRRTVDHAYLSDYGREFLESTAAAAATAPTTTATPATATSKCIPRPTHDIVHDVSRTSWVSIYFLYGRTTAHGSPSSSSSTSRIVASLNYTTIRDSPIEQQQCRGKRHQCSTNYPTLARRVSPWCLCCHSNVFWSCPSI
jgi:hypothetical protein